MSDRQIKELTSFAWIFIDKDGRYNWPALGSKILEKGKEGTVSNYNELVFVQKMQETD